MAKVELKQPIVDEISGYLNDAAGVVLVNYRGLTVEQDTQLRKPVVSYTHLRAHETDSYLVCRLLLEKKKNEGINTRAFMPIVKYKISTEKK